MNDIHLTTDEHKSKTGNMVMGLTVPIGIHLRASVAIAFRL